MILIFISFLKNLLPEGYSVNFNSWIAGSIVEFLDIIEPLWNQKNMGIKTQFVLILLLPLFLVCIFWRNQLIRLDQEELLRFLINFMTENLGYERYVAQGGDWGSAISTWLGFDHSKIVKVFLY